MLSVSPTLETVRCRELNERRTQEVRHIMENNKRVKRNGKTSQHGSANEDSRETSSAAVPLKEKFSRPRHPHTSTLPEKPQSIEDAVYIYAALRYDGSRPPIFLQRNLSYLKRKQTRCVRSLDEVVSDLSNEAVGCQKIKFSLMQITNVNLGHQPESTVLHVRFYLQKSCFKRRKTDITMKEKEILNFKLSYPHNFDPARHSFVLDTEEIASSLGSHHLSSCNLKGKFSLSIKKKPKPVVGSNGRRVKKKALESEPKFKNCEYICSLLLYSGGKTYISEESMHDLFLQPYSSSAGTVPQYMEWEELAKSPKLILESKQLSNKKSSRPQKGNSAAAAASSSLYERTQEMNVPNCDADVSSSTKESNKVYIVLQYKGAPQTTVQTGFNCPFCLKKTKPASLVYLLKHLRLCHDRLLFLYKESEASLLVTVNPYFDGSYSGNPIRNITSFIKPPKDRKEPERRFPFTEIINLRCNRKPVTLEEFVKPEPLASSYSLSLMGHNRLYYHSVTNQPILSNDYDYDSDGDDFDWTRTASAKLIDEFIDVNKGEKEFMKIWNQFMSLNPELISDSQMEQACITFVKQHLNIVSYKLRNNFLCHIATLYDCGVILPRQIQAIISTLLPKPVEPSANGVRV